ncbi:ATP-binding cassette domain-containing protein [Pseudobutyrivibrio sp.]|uniref:ATP-binding cassette domain-containing protein n=1 Tax=Pseudobutyrivibrio sp. TaxID=2014367 RepID=UPI001B47B810|nr:ATP-binding cassette domain-containing protein [Pseudobutyrivibrio sp.]MBP3262011.1 ATP-binding cassette domain-containing protein [Pseudobutyrivibrio sp.]
MGWFKNQIEERQAADQQLLEDAYKKVISSILGGEQAEKIQDKRQVIKGNIDEIMRFYHLRPIDVSKEMIDVDSEFDYILKSRGIMKRKIKLTEGWYKDAFGPILAFTKESNVPVVLIPGNIAYRFENPFTKKREWVNNNNAGLFDVEAYHLYRPLPNKKMNIIDLLVFMRQSLYLNDLVYIVLCSFMATATSMFLPEFAKILVGPILEIKESSYIVSLVICMICITVSYQLFEGIKTLLQSRIKTKISVNVESAMMMRIMSLPSGFFRKYSPGELCNRSLAVNQLCNTLVDIIMGSSLTAFVSLLYIFQIFSFAKSLTVPAIFIVLITLFFLVSTSMIQMKVDRELLNRQAKTAGLSYQFISGIKKLKLSGSEKRAYSKWLMEYAEEAKYQYNPPLFIKANAVFFAGINLFSTIVIYYIAVKSNLNQSYYYAFMASFGMLMGAFDSVSSVTDSFAQIKPILEMATPFLKTEPEIEAEKQLVNNVSGMITVENLSFKYNDDSQYVFKNLSLKVKPGDYVAIVGKTGCGKSTLIRLLLGLEHPQMGAIYYDNQNIDTMDLPSLRRKIGTVMQDSALFQGDIYSNIAITNPDLTEDEAWQAAEIAGIADDIKKMPMKMKTMITEGQGGISGGQRQRIMIARAIATRPKILFFDEATSALDNITQKQVSDALDKMGCTRIVIAHRLSTIKNCNKIIVINNGQIVESGTYEELIAKQQFFAELVKRQQLDSSQ